MRSRLSLLVLLCLPCILPAQQPERATPDTAAARSDDAPTARPGEARSDTLRPRAPGQPGAAIPAPSDTTRAAPAAPGPAGIVESGAPAGYEITPHGIHGFDLGHLNRVDGWSPGLGLALVPVRPDALPTLDLSAGMRTNRLDDPWIRVVASQIFSGLDRLQVTAEGYRETHTTDGWKVGPRENDVWVLLARTDLRNYYEAEGGRLSVSSSDLRPWGVALSFLSERNESLGQDPFFTLTTLFGDDDGFRRNPPVAEGRVTSVSLDARLVTASSQSPTLRVPGWNVSAGVERAWRGWGGDQTFWRGTLHVRRYARLSSRHWLSARAYLTGPLFGTDALPPQRFTYLGGPGSLPGFGTLELGGDRAVLGSLEYSFTLPNTSWSAPVFLLWQLEVFSNLGNAAGPRDPTRLYSDLHWDAGAGVSGVTVLGNLGLFVAQRLSDLDETSAGPRLLFRLQRLF